MRNLTLTAKQAIFAQQTDQAFLILLVIDYPTLAQPIRVVNNTQNVVSRGDTYIAFPFEIDLPEETDERLSRVTLRIDNIDRQIVQAVREAASPPTVTMEIVLASDPDTVEAGPFNFTLRDTRYDALTVEGDLYFEDILNEPYPGDSFTPANFPGLF